MLSEGKMRASDRFTEITNQNGLYNIQAIDNVPSIMQRGLLSNEKASRIDHVSIAMNEVQVRRDLVQVPNGLKLHQYANLYFDPRNPMLSRKRTDNKPCSSFSPFVGHTDDTVIISPLLGN